MRLYQWFDLKLRHPTWSRKAHVKDENFQETLCCSATVVLLTTDSLGQFLLLASNAMLSANDVPIL
jgi:hypothetical protein